MPPTRTTVAAMLKNRIRRVRLEKTACPNTRRIRVKGRDQMRRFGRRISGLASSIISLSSSWSATERPLEGPTCRAVRTAAPKRDRSWGFAETIADAVERFDHIEVAVNHLELLAKALDVAVDGTVVDIDLFVIGRIHQRVAALDHAGPLGKRMKNEEFGHGQGDRLASPGAGMPLLVHQQLATLERAG